MNTLRKAQWQRIALRLMLARMLRTSHATTYGIIAW